MSEGIPTVTDIAYNLELYAKGEKINPNIIGDAASYLQKIADGEYKPVVHAKSVFVNNGKVERWCSRCNHIIPKYAEWCPFCGAIMDESDMCQTQNGQDDSHAKENT